MGRVVSVGVGTAVVRVTTAAASVRVAMVSTSMLEHEDANQVDDQSQDRDDEEAIVFDGGRFEQSLTSFREDVEGDENEENAVCKAGQDLRSNVAIGKAVIGGPSGNNRRSESSNQGRAVEEHMERV